MDTPRALGRWPLLAHPLAVGAALLGLLLLLKIALDVQVVLLLGFFSVLLAIVLGFPVGLLARWMPRGLAVLATLALALGGATAMGALVLPRAANQLGPLAEQLPAGVSRAREWISGERGGPVSKLSVAQSDELSRRAEALAGQAVSGLLARAVPAAFGATEALIVCVLVLVLAAFLTYEPDAYRRGLRALIPTHLEPVFDEGWRRLGRDLRHWVGGILVSMTIMGTLAGLGLSLIGVEGALVLALFTFLGTFVPYLGALASAVPGLIVALAKSPTTFLAACGVYLGVHIFEGYVISPFVMRRAVQIRPALLLFGQACLGGFFGVMGVVVATPLLVCLQAVVQYLWVERRLGKPANA
ncbi:MAG: AI-2E family transporter [Deltaproteobacteria bacterium]|nr:AI-2E family transporter [Deltaproteobacteria bacterium]